MKLRRRYSVIWTISSNDFKEIVLNSFSYGEVLHKLGKSIISGGNHRTLKKRIVEEQIDVSHFIDKRTYEFKEKIPLEQVLVEHSTYSRGSLKRRLLKENILANMCSICNQLPEWNTKPLVLILDHRNGVNDDNRLENLRLLCPNCSSQTDTFAGRKHRKTYYCSSCGCEIHRRTESMTCRKCSNISLRRRIRPSQVVLLKQVERYGYRGTGKVHNVSDNAIRKWIR